MAKPIRNMGASVRARLLAIAKERSQPFQLLLTRYVLERLLYRLSLTEHRRRFVLKGAMLMTTWFDDPHRPTRDVDFLGFGDPDEDVMRAVFGEICVVALDDGVDFDAAALRADPIREEVEYGGLRIRTTATVGGARVNVVIDIGFGDAVEPGLEEVDLPVLLDLPPPRLRAYARETVIAEKFQAMVLLGRANSRLKDYYDIWVLSRAYEFPGERLARAIAATFARRGTAIPVERPDALTRAFAEDPARRQQWTAFLADVAADPGSLVEVVDAAVGMMDHRVVGWALESHLQASLSIAALEMAITARDPPPGTRLPMPAEAVAPLVQELALHPQFAGQRANVLVRLHPRNRRKLERAAVVPSNVGHQFSLLENCPSFHCLIPGVHSKSSRSTARVTHIQSHRGSTFFKMRTAVAGQGNRVKEDGPENNIVIPAKAGIHTAADMIIGLPQHWSQPWIPAFAGMTKYGKDYNPSPDCPATRRLPS